MLRSLSLSLYAALVLFTAGAFPPPAAGQHFELSAGWTLPFGELDDLTDGGPSVRGSFLYPVSWGYVLAWSGYSDHRGRTFAQSVFSFSAGKIDVQDVPFLAGVRFKPGRGYIDLTAGGLWKRLKVGAFDAAGTSIDPAAAVHAGLTIRGGTDE